ncbi:MAG: hypothetical protein COX07_02825, partial [Bacteroidetes bacterium CG23_combo_of_CG06-09_8_20_14_all_32_9]
MLYNSVCCKHIANLKWIKLLLKGEGIMCFFKIAATVIFLSVVFILPADAQDNEGYQAMAKALRNVIQENFDGYKEEDIAKIMTTVHTQSPGYLATKQISNEIFPPYELNY